MLEVKSFTDKNGKRGRVGDRVQIFDFYSKVMTDVICKVIKIVKQGNGTVLQFDTPPMPHISKYHKSHHARECVITLEKKK